MAGANKKSKATEADQETSAPERIVAAAATLFAAHGYDGTSTKDICEAAQVNIAAVHYHFGSKEELYLYIIKKFGGSRLQSVQRMLATPTTENEFRLRLEMFFSEYLEECLHQPELCRIVQVEVESMRPGSEKIFRETFMRLFDTLAEFLADAQKKGFLKQELNPRIAARILFSQLSHVTRNQALNSKFFSMPFDQASFRATWVQQVINVFLNGACSSCNQ